MSDAYAAFSSFSSEKNSGTFSGKAGRRKRLRSPFPRSWQNTRTGTDAKQIARSAHRFCLSRLTRSAAEDAPGSTQNTMQALPLNKAPGLSYFEGKFGRVPCTRRLQAVSNSFFRIRSKKIRVSVDVHKQSYAAALCRKDGGAICWKTSVDNHALLRQITEKMLAIQTVVCEAGPTVFPLARAWPGKG